MSVQLLYVVVHLFESLLFPQLAFPTFCFIRPRKVMARTLRQENGMQDEGCTALTNAQVSMAAKANDTRRKCRPQTIGDGSVAK